MKLLVKAIHNIYRELTKYKIALKVKSQGQMLPTLNHFQRSPWGTLEPTNLHQFLTSSYRDFVRTDRHTDTQTHRRTDAANNNTCWQHARR